MILESENLVALHCAQICQFLSTDPENIMTFNFKTVPSLYFS